MGEGKYDWADGTSYTGGWADNKYAPTLPPAADRSLPANKLGRAARRMHGKGTYVDGKAEVYEGEFFNGNGPELLNIQ